MRDSEPRPIRVMFVSRALDKGGAERFVSTVLSHLEKKQFDLELVLFRNILGYPLPDHVTLTILHPDPDHKWWQIPGLVLKLARAIRRMSPDVVVSAYSYPNIVTGFALMAPPGRTKWIARVSTNPKWEDTGLRRPLFRLAYRRTDSFIANSADLGDTFQQIYPMASGRMRHVPNPVDIAAIEEAADQPPLVPPTTRFRLVSVGRLAPAKRVDLLIAAVDQLRSHHDIELVVCGDGPLRESLQSIVDDLDLNDRVSFVGHVNPFPWMKSADLFVLASDHEGSPNALMEAQGLGTPAVSTNCEFGPSEILEDGTTGRLVPVGDVDGLVAAIDEAIGDSAWRASAGEAARERAHALFDASRVTQEFSRHLLQLHRGDHPASAGLSNAPWKAPTGSRRLTDGDRAEQPDE